MTNDKMNQAKVQIQMKNPFFSYLSLFVKAREATEDELAKLDEIGAGGGVFPDGTLIYKSEWLDTLTNEEVVGFLAHEILHLALLHLTRRGEREPQKWNFSADLVVNQTLLMNHFKIPEQGLIPSGDSYSIPQLKINVRNISSKSVEEIYDEIPDFPNKDKGSGSVKVRGFDEHGEGQSSGGEEEKEKIEGEWSGRVKEAYIQSKQKGNLPAGIERYIEKLHSHKIKWENLLRRAIQNSLPVDYSYAKPSKKEVAVGVYLPSIIKDKIEIVTAMDVSGSIGTKELTDFLSEIVGMTKGNFQVDMTILVHDVEVQGNFNIREADVSKIKRIEINGGGGTSHKPVFKWIKDNKKDCKLAIFFTDGYSDIDSIDMKDYGFEKIFVINSGGTDNQCKGKGQVIRI